MITVAKALKRKEEWEGALIISTTGESAESKASSFGLYIQDKSELPAKLYRQKDSEAQGKVLYQMKYNSGSIGEDSVQENKYFPSCLKKIVKTSPYCSLPGVKIVQFCTFLGKIVKICAFF